MEETRGSQTPVPIGGSERPRAVSPSPVKNRAEKMARVQWGIGLAVTLVMLAISRTDLLDRLEFQLQDFNASRFTSRTPDPDPRLVMIGIDDPSQTTVGKWPWPRERLAQVVRELTRAGAGVIALDLLQDDPQAPRAELDPDDPTRVIRMVDGDAEFAEAVRAHGKVVLGGSFPFDELVALEERRTGGGGVDRVKLRDVYAAIVAEPTVTDDALRRKFLGAEAEKAGAEQESVTAKIAKARVLLAKQARFSVPVPAGESYAFPVSSEPGPPVARILEAGERLASVSFGSTDVDRAVRRVPMWVQQGGRLYPTLGLSAATLLLGIEPSAITIREGFTVLRRPDGSEARFRMHSASLLGLEVADGLHYVTWPRGASWKEQFIDRESRRRWEDAYQEPPPLELALPRLEGAASSVCETPVIVPPTTRDRVAVPPGTDLPIGKLLDPALTGERIRDNVRKTDRALNALAVLGVGLVERSDEHTARSRRLVRTDPDAPEWRPLYEQHRESWIEALTAATRYLEAFAEIPQADLQPEERRQLDLLRDAYRGLHTVIPENDYGLRNIDLLRATLKDRVQGRLCMVGWTATGALADFVQTSIDQRTPGVYVHGAVANSVLTTYARVASGPRVVLLGVLGVVLMGVLGTFIGVRLSVVAGPIVLALTLAGWVFASGLLVWDLGGFVSVFATPMLAAALAWLSVLLHRLLVEQRGRKQTEARFRAYVSPDVVDILVNNPDLQSMEPQRRELTIMFSDVANWTTLTERLGTEGIYKFLSTYLGEMTDIIQKNKATLDKYLGDGIMAFWGAPITDPDHAKNAAKACVEMLDRLDEMNRTGGFGAAGAIEVRFGIATGEVNVGDFGNPPHKSAYTVIGDAVNLAARLESSNKQFGTSILMTKRVVELSGSTLLFRPIGRIVVKGKTEYEELYELIGDRKPKGDRTAEWIKATNDAVGAYQAGRLDEAERLFSTLHDDFGDTKLAKLYLHGIEDLRQSGIPDGWEGTLVLTEK